MATDWYAISVKQPWAALLVAGVKTVEVRTWATPRRGPILIHASKTPDPRPEAWEWVTTPELVAAAALTGGVVGAADLAECVEYRDPAAFAADRPRHLNHPDWFRPEGLYGFAFRGARPVPFLAYSGQTFFFRVRGYKVTPLV